MTQKIIVAGSGFAGMWAAISAARAVSLAGKANDVDIAVVSPAANLCIRPRLYESVIENMNPDIAPLLDAIGVTHIAGLVERIDIRDRSLAIITTSGEHQTLGYDRFVLATGSQLFQPNIPGLTDHSFNVDQLDTALRLAHHLRSLADLPDTPERNTVVVAGGGFTGLETVMEMPSRLRKILGYEPKIRVIIVDPAPAIGADLGLPPQPFIQEALAESHIESRPNATVTAVDADGVTLSTGERIATRTLVWTAGARAHPLATQLPGAHDRFGRVVTDEWLRAEAADGVFVTGDVACARTDTLGNVAAMSCQHAMSLGRVAGHNAAAELVGLPLHPYSQPKYVTCLDLGAWGALLTEGWDRHVVLTKDAAKATKREINTKWIYPPVPDRQAAFAIANPDFVIVA